MISTSFYSFYAVHHILSLNIVVFYLTFEASSLLTNAKESIVIKEAEKVG